MTPQVKPAVGERTAAKITAPSVKESISREQSRPPALRTSHTKFEDLASRTYRGNRSLDILLGSLAFFAFSILYPFIAIGIKLSSRGPVLYAQKRTGKDGEVFTCYKFRTMHQIELRRIDGKPVVTQKGDKRIFKFGSILRKTNLDELPQILNVLQGDMSLVGPRPYALEECKHWNNTFSDHHYRYAVKPGITGYAQVNGLRGGTHSEEHMRQRLDKDLAYVRKQSISFDLYIIWHTVLQMLKLETNAH